MHTQSAPLDAAHIPSTAHLFVNKPYKPLQFLLAHNALTPRHKYRLIHYDSQSKE
ncbi:hypothetical protein D3C79_935460 [compost metagenome]